MSQSPRSVSRFRAWYFGVRLSFCERSPENPLQGGLKKMTLGFSLPAALRTSSTVASRQSIGGSQPWKSLYCSRSNKSNKVAGTPTLRVKSRTHLGSTSNPPRVRNRACKWPTRGSPLWKPIAPPPRPQKPKNTLYSTFVVTGVRIMS